ncbi:rCG50135 [Rattus norvegicus]|uniref:RCG50135 n=1 Tax=Rattus norvegicus TaxID=10116 RepID=A6JVJ4_RAT|nr:rCG50135 [Rattus norvegicus]
MRETQKLICWRIGLHGGLMDAFRDRRSMLSLSVNPSLVQSQGYGPLQMKHRIVCSLGLWHLSQMLYWCPETKPWLAPQGNTNFVSGIFKHELQHMTRGKLT